MTINLRVVDIYHGDIVTDLAVAKIAGICGVIHKASQGAATEDSMYPIRRKRVLAAGMLWGAYHFLTNEPAEQQADRFLKAATPDAQTLMALDFEPSKMSPTLPILRSMCQILEATLGRKVVIYSGSLLKEALGAAPDAYLGSHRLWLCEYASEWKLAPLTAWQKPWLWQYSGDGLGPEPHSVKGIPGSRGSVDCNHYDGTPAQLAAEWAA